MMTDVNFPTSHVPRLGNTVMRRGQSRLTDIALGAMVGGELVGN
ncbi:hypothetical protein [Bradyrhizobium sp. CCGE-LA001]|nr:hypothetical protein [Bradyrhizobium sp. CCGE-LA001]